MYLPKSDIYSILKELNYPVYQSQPTLFDKLPVINFEVLDNNVELFLDNTIAYQNIELKIDIWADDSVTASKILSEVEGKMRLNQYKLSYSADVPNMGNVYHLTTRFKNII